MAYFFLVRASTAPHVVEPLGVAALATTTQKIIYLHDSSRNGLPSPPCRFPPGASMFPQQYREEDLVADGGRVAGRRSLPPRSDWPLSQRSFDLAVPGHAVEDGRGERRRLDPTLMFTMKMFSPDARPPSRDIEQDGLVITTEDRLALSQDRVHVLNENLAAHHVDVDVHAGEELTLARMPFADALLRRGMRPVPGGDDGAVGFRPPAPWRRRP